MRLYKRERHRLPDGRKRCSSVDGIIVGDYQCELERKHDGPHRASMGDGRDMTWPAWRHWNWTPLR